MISFKEFIFESRGLTHDGNVGGFFADKQSPKKDVYQYLGFEFFADVRSEIENKDIIRTYGRPQPSGALFKFVTKDGKEKFIVKFSKSVTSRSSITPKDFDIQHHGRKGATENLGINASTMIKGGKLENKELNGINIKCYVFTDANQLNKSILNGLKANKSVPLEIFNCVDDYLSGRTKTFVWDGIEPSSINELGKYLGELLIGVLVLGAGNGTISSEMFGNKGIRDFFIPNDASFSGLDSAFTLHDGSIVPISSKLGSGAQASIFTNIIATIIDMDSLGNSVLGGLCSAAKRVGVDKSYLKRKRGSREIVYEYGIRDILGISSLEIPNTMEIFNETITNPKPEDYSDQLRLVIDSIERNAFIGNKVKSELPLSITSAFSREIARRLNDDKLSYDIVTQVMVAKSFYQCNLDLNKWKRGEVHFKVLLSGEAYIKFIGSKSAINDIRASQGSVNYELKYK